MNRKFSVYEVEEVPSLYQTMEKNVIAIAAEGHYDKNEKLLMSWDFLYSIITIVREETENRARYEQFVQNKELLDKIDCYLNEI